MPAPKIKRPLIIFALFYLVWCYLAIKVLAPAIAKEQLENHILIICYLLCLLPLALFGLMMFVRMKK
jgi:hypothetical protein